MDHCTNGSSINAVMQNQQDIQTVMEMRNEQVGYNLI